LKTQKAAAAAAAGAAKGEVCKIKKGPTRAARGKKGVTPKVKGEKKVTKVEEDFESGPPPQEYPSLPILDESYALVGDEAFVRKEDELFNYGFQMPSRFNFFEHHLEDRPEYDLTVGEDAFYIPGEYVEQTATTSQYDEPYDDSACDDSPDRPQPTYNLTIGEDAFMRRLPCLREVDHSEMNRDPKIVDHADHVFKPRESGVNLLTTASFIVDLTTGEDAFCREARKTLLLRISEDGADNESYYPEPDHLDDGKTHKSKDDEGKGSPYPEPDTADGVKVEKGKTHKSEAGEGKGSPHPDPDSADSAKVENGKGSPTPRKSGRKSTQVRQPQYDLTKGDKAFCASLAALQEGDRSQNTKDQKRDRRVDLTIGEEAFCVDADEFYAGEECFFDPDYVQPTYDLTLGVPVFCKSLEGLINMGDCGRKRSKKREPVYDLTVGIDAFCVAGGGDDTEDDVDAYPELVCVVSDEKCDVGGGHAGPPYDLTLGEATFCESLVGLKDMSDCGRKGKVMHGFGYDLRVGIDAFCVDPETHAKPCVRGREDSMDHPAHIPHPDHHEEQEHSTNDFFDQDVNLINEELVIGDGHLMPGPEDIETTNLHLVLASHHDKADEDEARMLNQDPMHEHVDGEQFDHQDHMAHDGEHHDGTSEHSAGEHGHGEEDHASEASSAHKEHGHGEEDHQDGEHHDGTSEHSAGEHGHGDEDHTSEASSADEEHSHGEEYHMSEASSTHDGHPGGDESGEEGHTEEEPVGEGHSGGEEHTGEAHGEEESTGDPPHSDEEPADGAQSRGIGPSEGNTSEVEDDPEQQPSGEQETEPPIDDDVVQIAAEPQPEEGT